MPGLSITLVLITLCAYCIVAIKNVLFAEAATQFHHPRPVAEQESILERAKARPRKLL